MKTLLKIFLGLSLIVPAFAADDVVSAIHGTVEKIDAASKVVAVKTADGTIYTLRFTKNTAIHGANATATAGKASWHGIETGSEVVAHYTKRGAQTTAVEIDRVGQGGFEITKGTVMAVGRGGKTIAVKTSDGTVKTFQLTTRVAKYAGTGVAKGTQKGAEVTVYSTRTAGQKVAHFFEAA